MALLIMLTAAVLLLMWNIAGFLMRVAPHPLAVQYFRLKHRWPWLPMPTPPGQQKVFIDGVDWHASADEWPPVTVISPETAWEVREYFPLFPVIQCVRLAIATTLAVSFALPLSFWLIFLGLLFVCVLLHLWLQADHDLREEASSYLDGMPLRDWP
jgi:hypothetical protein